MEFKLFLCCFLVFCSCLFVGYSRELQSLDEIVDGFNPTGGNVGGGSGGGGDSMSCVTKLLPCKAYLNASSSSPPATCCIPLNEAVTNEAECLCNVLHNPEVMKSFNVTLDDALNVAKACGANADLTKCKSASSPTSTPTTPSSPTNSSTGGSSSNNTSSAGNGISHFGGVGFIAFLGVLLAVK
ncbi:hypothetical protein Ddye_003136 [Dipteronia dyeriana]|uniref:Bifunctional inhibitor/plant lipid transfer protein/seed storage helical domain-containing protein n=1 Tax=Dipteronia dyeriana TaxID=168575 RepID=A0AAD9XSW5_9ROSI|nr:hypothetical protein Ddye_003136 [Dipteronia dyeriana]